MRQIRLEAVLEFGNRAEFAIIDMTDTIDVASEETKAVIRAKKRGTISVDYAPADLKLLLEQKLDYDGIMRHYEKRIYCLVHYYISGDWEYYGNSKAEVMALIDRHISSAILE